MRATVDCDWPTHLRPTSMEGDPTLGHNNGHQLQLDILITEIRQEKNRALSQRMLKLI